MLLTWWLLTHSSGGEGACCDEYGTGFHVSFQHGSHCGVQRLPVIDVVEQQVVAENDVCTLHRRNCLIAQNICVVQLVGGTQQVL